MSFLNGIALLCVHITTKPMTVGRSPNSRQAYSSSIQLQAIRLTGNVAPFEGRSVDQTSSDVCPINPVHEPGTTVHANTRQIEWTQENCEV